MWRQKVKVIRLSLLYPYSNQVLANGRGVELLRHGHKGGEVEKGLDSRLSLTNTKLNCIAYRNRLRFLQSALIVIHYYAITML